jgi:hypothetical protein
MRREEFMVRNDAPFARKSTEPSTMASNRVAPHTAAHPAVNTSHLSHPHTGEQYNGRTGASFPQPPPTMARNTIDESLCPSDPAAPSASFLSRLKQTYLRYFGD